MTSLKASLAIGVLFALLLVGFQNCAGEMYQPTVIGASSLSDECYGGMSESCADHLGRTGDQLFLRARGEQYIDVARGETGTTYLELGGDCYDAAYPKNEIVYQILEMRDTGSQVSESVFHSGILGSCSAGNFHVVLKLPGDYNYNYAYTLKLQLMAYNERGQSVTGPSASHRLELVPPAN